jgi:hypothetical protein
MPAAAGADAGIYALGGYSTPGVPVAVATAELYLINERRWTSLPSLNSARAYLGAGVMPDGSVIATGGTTPPGNSEVATSETYTPGSAMWAALPALPAPRASFGAVVGRDGNFYVVGGIGGQTGMSANWVPDVFAYADFTWVTVPPLPGARGRTSAALGADGRIYAIGGQDSIGFLNTVQAYATSVGWSATAAMPEERHSCAAAGAPDGRIYVVGYGDTTFAYLPSADLWQQAPPLHHPRTELGLAVGDDGRLYAIGGSDGTNALAFVEAYGPVIMLSAATGAAGSAFAVTGFNFAAGAGVQVFFDDAPAALASGQTDAAGTLIGSLGVTVPATSPGAHRVRVVDARSRYPVSARFTVQ